MENCSLQFRYQIDNSLRAMTNLGPSFYIKYMGIASSSELSFIKLKAVKRNGESWEMMLGKSLKLKCELFWHRDGDKNLQICRGWDSFEIYIET